MYQKKISTNRLEKDTLRKEWGQNYDVAPRPAFYKNTADRYQATKENKSQEIIDNIEFKLSKTKTGWIVFTCEAGFHAITGT